MPGRLQPGEISAIQENFAVVKQDSQRLGNNLLGRYLYGNPQDQKLFPKFADVPIVELAGDAAYNTQTKTIIDFLGQVVDNLGDIEKARGLLAQRVSTHKPRGIAIAQFERLLDLVPRFLEEEAGASGAVSDAWRIAIANLLPAVRAAYV